MNYRHFAINICCACHTYMTAPSTTASTTVSITVLLSLLWPPLLITIIAATSSVSPATLNNTVTIPTLFVLCDTELV